MCQKYTHLGHNIVKTLRLYSPAPAERVASTLKSNSILTNKTIKYVLKLHVYNQFGS